MDDLSLFSIPKWDIEEFSGYKPMTSFWMDFSIADNLGVKAIQDTYDRAKAEWKNDFQYWTELCLVLNHKIWQFYEKDEKKARLYNRLWEEADEMTNDWSYEEQEYYFKITD